MVTSIYKGPREASVIHTHRGDVCNAQYRLIFCITRGLQTCIGYTLYVYASAFVYMYVYVHMYVLYMLVKMYMHMYVYVYMYV